MSLLDDVTFPCCLSTVHTKALLDTLHTQVCMLETMCGIWNTGTKLATCDRGSYDTWLLPQHTTPHGVLLSNDSVCGVQDAFDVLLAHLGLFTRHQCAGTDI